MGLFDFLKPKKKNSLSQEEIKYAQQIDWKTIFLETHKEGSMNDALQKLALRYKELKGNVEKDSFFIETQNELNELQQLIAEPTINYKALFDRFLDINAPLKEDDSENKMTFSYQEIIKLIDDVGREETKEQQKALVSHQNTIAHEHRCSIHNKPIDYSFILKGTNVQISIDNECCEQSMKELVKKLTSQ